MATGPGGKNVGRVSVRVVPDTTGFRRELDAQLKAIERGLKISIPVEVDQRAIKNAITNMTADLANVDPPNFQLTRLQKDLGNVALATDVVITKVKHLTASVSTHLRRMVSVRQHWDFVSRKITDTARGLGTVRGATNAVYTSVLGLSRVVGNIGRTAARGAGIASRAFTKMGKDVTGLTQVMQGVGSAFSSALGFLTNLSRGMLIFIAILALAGPVLGLVASLLASLPALAAAFLAPIAAIAIGFDGIKAAATTLQKDFERLQKTVSAAFQKGLTPVFQQLKALFPVLERGLVAVTQGVVAIADSFVKVLTSAKGLAQMEGLLKNVGGFLTSITPAITAMTDALLTLAFEGSRSFSQLAGFLNGFFQEFNAIVQQVSANGLLADAIKGMTQVVSALGHVFNQLFLTGLQIMAQMSGPLSSALTSLGDLVAALAPVFVVLANVFSNGLTAAIQVLVPVIQTLAGPLATIAQLFSNTLAGALEAIAPLALVVAGSIAQLVTMLANTLAPILPILINFLSQVAQMLGTHISAALDILFPLIQMFVTFLGNLLANLTPLLPMLLTVATAISQALLQALTAIMPALLELGTALFPLILQVIQAVIPILPQLVNAILTLLPPITDLVILIAGALIPVFQAVLAVVQAVMPSIQAIIQSVLGIIVGLINAFAAILKGDWKALWEALKTVLKSAWEGILAALKGAWELVKQFFTTLLPSILGVLGDVGSWLLQVGKDLIMGFLNGIKQMAGRIKDAVLAPIKGAIDGVKNFLGINSPSRLMMQIGVWTGQGMEIGLEKSMKPVVDLAVQSAADISEAFTTGNPGESLVESIENSLPAATRAIEEVVDATQKAATMGLDSTVEAEGFGNMQEQLVTAMEGWTFQMDATGVWTMVKKEDNRRARR